jgi:hypothetical protein
VECICLRIGTNWGWGRDVVHSVMKFQVPYINGVFTAGLCCMELINGHISMWRNVV